MATIGDTCEYRPRSGARYFIRGVFDREYQAIDTQTNAVISGNLPRLGVRLSDLVNNPVKGDKIQIGDELFTVSDCQEDGQGGATLYLHKA
jgi:hypothetical protein